MKKFILMILPVVMIACGGSSGGGKSGDQPHQGGQGATAQRYVDLDSVASEHNLEKEQFAFNITNSKRVRVNLNSFAKSFEVSYADIPADEGRLELYTVTKNARVVLSGADINHVGDNINIRKRGNYSCSISVTDYRISDLEGSCYIAVKVILPKAAKLEVYNVGKLMSKMLFAMTSDDLIEEMRMAPGSEKKLAVIQNFIKSHEITNSKMDLIDLELSEVLSFFHWSEQKFEVLKKLHTAVEDRESLRAVIKERFGHFDREDALKICGLSL